MNGADRRDYRSASLAGKIVLIGVVIICSSLSFVLGYFVGRSEEPKKPEPSRIAEVISESPRVEVQPPRPVVPDAPQENTSTTTVATAVTEAPKPAGTETKAEAKTSEAAATGTSATPSPERPAVRSDEKGDTATKVSYTVQLGALRNAAEAARIRKKYEKKGYKTYVVITRNKKHDKLYKIRIGEFLERKDAEILSLKLKKAEGLQSFVTTGKP